jgi:hypothetical protein
MNCRHCGARLAPDDLVCGTCGHAVDTAPLAPTVASHPVPRTSSAKTRRVSVTTLLILAFACGFLGLIAAAGVGGAYTGLQDRTADEQARADEFYQSWPIGRPARFSWKADFDTSSRST